MDMPARESRIFWKESYKTMNTSDKAWFLNRLKAMNIREILWRIQQKGLQKAEYAKYYRLHLPVTEIPVSNTLKKLYPQKERIALNLNNACSDLFEKIDMFGLYDYQEYKSQWNAGFQTDNQWPLRDFSYSIKTSQREDLGDIRTNWELNRHVQFVGLAKNFYLTGERSFLSELKSLFADWNKKNLFLHGVQWTSAMEISIRIISWVYMYYFVSAGFEKHHVAKDQDFMDNTAHGILVMADYVVSHRARFSSANNHLIVEMLGVGIGGILFNHKRWIDLSVAVLTEELPKQNSVDGVNREMSLHYQSFVMEAYGIMWLHIKKNRMTIPSVWKKYLTRMSEFLADCCGDYGEVIIFGDNDEGKILDFCGHIDHYYHYVLQLMGLVLDRRYTNTALAENIRWLAEEKETDKYWEKALYQPDLAASYAEGGYTILRSTDRQILIGFDHARLGFGNIAAHGHADALSVQMFCRGVPVLVDSGTYNYHVPKNMRDDMRCTRAHNTVYAGREQAEMQGPFLWGKRFEVSPAAVERTEHEIRVSAEIKYDGICHTRYLYFDFDKKMRIKDEVSGIPKAVQVWNISEQAWETHGGRIQLEMKTDCRNKNIVKKNFSESYGHLKKMFSIELEFSEGIETNFAVVEDDST